MLANSVQNFIPPPYLKLHLLYARLLVAKLVRKLFHVVVSSPLILRLYNLYLPVLFFSRKTANVRKLLILEEIWFIPLTLNYRKTCKQPLNVFSQVHLG